MHETAEGELDFTGARDVVAFLELAAERGLRATIRPGPACGAELPDHGYPWRVLRRPEVQGRRPNGSPYILPTATHQIPVPSYASTEFLAEIDRWYQAVGERLAPLQWPEGPIVACQVDNEMGFFFQSHPYALDYHPEAVAEFRKRFGWDPPTDGEDGPELRRLDWMRFREGHVRDALWQLATMLRAAGIDRVPLFHNDYARTETPLDIGALESSGAVDVAGLDAYSGRQGSRWLADTLRHLAGSSRLPWMPELGTGWLAMPWLLPADITPADHETAVLTATAVGVRAYNAYMLVERDRWYGSPIDRRGDLRPGAELHRSLQRFFDGAGLEDLLRDVSVLLLENRVESQRLEAHATLGDLVPAFAGVIPFDFSLTTLPDPRREQRATWTAGLRDAVARAGCDYDRATSSALPDLGRYRVIAVPVLEALEIEAVARLDESGAIVACGPALPALDERLEPLEQPAGWHLLESPEDLTALLPAPAISAPHPDVEVVRWTGGGREVIALLHHSGEARQVELPLRLEPLWPEDGGAIEGSVGLRPWSVAFFEVVR